MQVDFSKGLALHRLYGHQTFQVEATKAGKDARFIKHVCQSIQCSDHI